MKLHDFHLLPHNLASMGLLPHCSASKDSRDVVSRVRSSLPSSFLLVHWMKQRLQPFVAAFHCC